MTGITTENNTESNTETVGVVKNTDMMTTRINVYHNFLLKPYERMLDRRKEIHLDFMPSFMEQFGVKKEEIRYETNGVTESATVQTDDYYLTLMMRDTALALSKPHWYDPATSVKIEDDLECGISFSGTLKDKHIADTLVKVVLGYYSAPIAIKRSAEREGC